MSDTLPKGAAPTGTEHERRWLILTGERNLTLPPVWVRQEQSYLAIESWGEERLRQEINSQTGLSRYFHTFKGKGVESRAEHPAGDEGDIPRWLWDILCARDRVGDTVWKDRFVLPIMDGARRIQLDKYLTFPGLYTAEVEVPTAEDLDRIVLPPYAAGWLDITKRKDMKNASLAVNGIPHDVIDMVLEASGVTISMVEVPW